MNSEDILTLDLILIKTGGGTQSRTGVDKKVIDEYAEALREGAKFPPLEVFHDGKDYWLADGFHRYYAGSQIGLRQMHIKVHQGTRRDAILYSVGANAVHGLRRTNADKRRAVECLLKDDEWVQWSDREIARRCGVDNAFVGKIRKEEYPASVDNQQIERTVQVQRNGATYTQKVKVAEKPATTEIPSLDADLEQLRHEQVKANGLLAVMQSEAGHSNGNGTITDTAKELPIIAVLNNNNGAIPADEVIQIGDHVNIVDGDKYLFEVGIVESLLPGNAEEVAVTVVRANMPDETKFFNHRHLRRIDAITADVTRKVGDETRVRTFTLDEIELIKECDDAIGAIIPVETESVEEIITPAYGKFLEAENSRLRTVYTELKKELAQALNERDQCKLGLKDLRKLLERSKGQAEDLATELKKKDELLARVGNELLECRAAAEEYTLVGDHVKVISEESPHLNSLGIALEGRIKQKNGRVETSYSVQLDGASMKNSFLEGQLVRIEND